MSKHPKKRFEYRHVIYSTKQERVLEKLRMQAIRVMEALEKFHLRSIVHGSVARGDVKKNSDVDVFIPDQVSSFMVKTALEKMNISVARRVIVQATPSYIMKAHLEIDERASVSFPLMKMRRAEREFYQFGGEASLSNLRLKRRVCGVDKRLMLIEPIEKGHIESTIFQREEEVAKLLGISIETVLGRVRVLLRRSEVGRTGLFIERELEVDETFEMALKREADQNPAIRRRLRTG